ncbi:filamentous hemagglutinin N-terminal domain-containing protein [Campylobacter lari]|uniref:two-partner secretion domain-containing protein n=1 Tax=Campylobacter lari TaxID=201 RepID=UPI003990AD9E
MKKLANHIILSGVTVSMLFSPLMALPSGGKFTHGTSGSINKPNDKTMNIIGNGKNSVIQWGGGFNIANGEKVNFGGKDKNYLNIAHGTSKSMIEGLLNAGGNNVFLINPNGVIITKTGIINANRFVASTSSMDSKSMQEFADGKYTNGKVIDYTTFSPVFKPSKAGNVVNMGNINANDVLLIGNKVDVQGGKIGNANSTTHLVGKNVYIDVDTKLNSTINVTATDGGYIQRQMIKFAEDKYNFGDNVKVNVVNYKDSNGKTHKGSSNFKKALTIGNMGNEKDNAIEWWHFAKGWNEGLGVTREIDEFRLVGDIDFSGNQGKGVESKDWQNYANYCIDGLGCTSMIVGFDREKVFTKTFDGQGFTLKNINILTKDLDDNKPMYVGIFGYTNEAHIENIIVDYDDGIVKGFLYVGGIVGFGINGAFKNIILKNIGYLYGGGSNRGDFVNVGGFAGVLSGVDAYNIQIENIDRGIYGTSSSSHSTINIGGFAGLIHSGNYNTIKLDYIGFIIAMGDWGLQRINEASLGGFVGFINTSISDKKSLVMENITLNKVRQIFSENYTNTMIGGFLGKGNFVSGFYSFKNIALLNGMESIGVLNDYRDFIGGFAGYLNFWNSAQNNTFFENIFIYFENHSSFGNESTNSDLFARSSDSLKINNVYVYYDKNSEFANFATNLNKVIEKPYISSDNLKQDFELKIKDIKTPNFVKNHSDVSLEQDDLNKEVITQIIEDITQKGYVVDIARLEKLLEDYNKFNENTTEGKKIAFIQTYFNIKDENEARGILQSLDFLTYYTKNETFDKNRISNEAKDLFISLQNQSKTTLTNNEALFSYLNNNKDKLIAEYNKYKELEQIFKDKEQDYFKAQAEFNRLLDLVNKGKLSYNDPKFTQAFDNWLNAYNEYNALSNDISELNNNVASISNGVKDLGYTNFSFAKFDDITKIDLDKPEIPNIDNSLGGDLPDFEQTASLNLIGDNALDEEEKTEEVDETSLMQKSKTCIVSDNYKTMNPCIVGGL